MDVRLVSDEGVEQHPVEEFQALLQREDGLVWVDIPARPGRTRVPGRSGQPAKVGGVFGRLADLQYSQGLASGSIARSMSLTDHSDRPSAVM
jgi:hypothetical protein